MAKLPISKAMQVGDDQPRFGASFNPISRPASPAVSSASAYKSSLASSPGSVRWRGSRNGVTAAAINPGMTLIKNSHGQDQLSVIQPPTIGPTVGANTATTPPTVVAIV